jgi:5-methylcytosine-specific restriction endonuclease McrA
MKNKLKQWFNKSRLRSAIRREWLYSTLRKEALARARIDRGKYKCESCGKVVGNKDIEVNHRVTVTPPQGLNTGADWGEFIHRLLFCGLENLETICSGCHSVITAKEREEKAKRKVKKNNT